MRFKSAHIVWLLVGVFALTIISCSSQKNTSKSRFWQSFTAKYNVYYNGTVAYIDGSVEKENGNKDNYTEIIPLYTVGNKKSAEIGKGNFDKAIEKCEKTIKLHSIKTKPEWTKNRRKTEKDIEWLSRREYNPMMWKAWMLMGRSQFHKGDFEAASATFSYMSRLYQTQPAIYAKARAWLAKCYIEEDWLYDAEDIIRNMSRDSIHYSAKKEWDYTYADYYIHTGDYDKAIPYLQQVIKHEGRKKQKAREWYLLGQLYAQLNRPQDAYKAFAHVIRQNPPYELEFNARIAQTEVLAADQAKKMISKLKRMARNENNKDYLDQVYYALGNIYMAEKDTMKAISAYEKGNKEATRSGVEKGVLLLRLGDIYWDMEKFSDAGRCYGEAIGLLDKEREDYKQLSERSKVLDELVPFTEAVHLQDSLLELSEMPEADRNAAIDRVIAELKKKEKEEKDRLAEQAAQETMSKNGAQGNNMNNRPKTPQQNNQQQNGQWYFYNQMAVNQGKQAFMKEWGKRENADHWQRNNKTVVNFGTDEEMAGEEGEAKLDSLGNPIAEDLEKTEEENDTLANDPHNREFYLAQIPFSEEDKEAAHLIIQDGLYNAGVIFKDKLDNLPLSKKQFDRLESQYPEYEGMDNAYYHEFLLYSRLSQHDVADGYVEKLKEQFPESQWTTLLTDPYYVENQKFGAHIEDSLYTATYAAFKEDNFNVIKANTRISAERFPLGANRDKFVFISGLSKLNAGDSEGCLEDMNAVVKDFPQSKLATMAGMIVNGVKEGKKLRGGRFDVDDVWARRSAVMADSDSLAARTFSEDTNLDFVFMIAYEPDSVNENQLLYELAKYNFTSYMVRNFELQLEDQDGLHVMLVTGFNNYEEALEYARQFYQQENILKRLGKARTFVISKPNRELLGVNFSYDDYDKFYTEHFEPLDITERQLLFEQGDNDDLDDGGSLPSNITPTARPEKLQRPDNPDNPDNPEYPADPESPARPEIPVDEGFVVEDEAPSVPAAPADNNNIVIEDEAPAVPIAPANDDNVVIEDEAPVVPVAPVDDNSIIIEDESPASPVAEDDGFVIDDDTPSAPADDDDGFILEDDTPAAPANTDDNIVVVDEGSSSEGTEDEYFELDGF